MDVLADRGDGLVRGQLHREVVEVDEAQVVAHLVRVVAPVGGVALAEPARAAVAPALELPVVEAGAGALRAQAQVGGRAPGPELGDREVVAHLAGPVAVRGGVALAELARRRVAPALELAVVERGAGVVPARRDAGGGASAAEVDGGEVVAHLAGRAADDDGLADAELALQAVAPALDRAVVEEGTSMEVGGGDRGRGPAGAEVDGGQVVAQLAGTVAAGVGVAQAELAVVVPAPALHRAVVEEGADPVRADGHLGGRAAGAQVHGGEVVTHLAGGVAAVGGVAEAEEAEVVEAPALDGTVVEQGTRLEARRADGGGGAAGAEVDGGEVVAHLARAVAPVVGAPCAEGAEGAAAPALDGGVVEDCAGVEVAGGQGDGGAAGSEVDRGEVLAHLVDAVAAVGGVAEAELAAAVVPPAPDLPAGGDGAGVLVAGGDPRTGCRRRCRLAHRLRRGARHCGRRGGGCEHRHAARDQCDDPEAYPPAPQGRSGPGRCPGRARPTCGPSCRHRSHLPPCSAGRSRGPAVPAPEDRAADGSRRP